jgi:hypothetical protein
LYSGSVLGATLPVLRRAGFRRGRPLRCFSTEEFFEGIPASAAAAFNIRRTALAGRRLEISCFRCSAATTKAPSSRRLSDSMIVMGKGLLRAASCQGALPA